MAGAVTTNTPPVGYGPKGNPGPFSLGDMDRLSEALTMSSRETGINFSVYIGDLGPDRRGALAERHRSFGAEAADTCLIAVSPNEKAVEIAVGERAAKRLSDRSCQLAVAGMVSSFEGGDLVGGIVNGLRLLSDQAGHPVTR